MTYIFILSLSIILYVYFGYPLFLLILSKLKPISVEKKDIYPMVSLIISVYNEESLIEKKIRNTLELDYPKNLLEVIVASESNDQTNEIVKKYKNFGIKLIAFENRQGKPATLFKVVPISKGEILVFSDANAMYDKMAIKKMVRSFNDKSVGCVSGMMRYKNPKGTSSGKGETAFWNYENYLKKISSGAVTGSIFALRRDAYLPLNKYRGDDFELTVNAVIHGYKVVFEEEALSYEEVYDTTEKEYNRKVRVVSWNFESALMLLREALKKKKFFILFKILSHRTLRWLAPFFLIMLLISNLMIVLNYDSLIYKCVLGCQIFSYLIGALSFIADKYYNKKLLTIFWVPYYFCMVNYAAFVGVNKVLFKKTGTLWEVNR